MKKTFTAILCIVMIMMLAIPAFAVETAKNAGTVAGTSDAMILDGKMDKSYEKGLKVEGFTLKEGKAGAAKVTYYITYTKSDIWVYAEIKDSVVKATLSKENPTYHMIDSIEVMLDLDNKGANTPEVTPWQMRVDYTGYLTGRKGQKGTTLVNAKTNGGTVDFFDAKAVVVDGGFNAEYKIPVTGLSAGKKIGFNFMYNDLDETGKKREVQSTSLKVDSWQPSKYDYFVLGEIAAPTPATNASSTPAASPATSDISVILTIISAVAASGAVIIKKKH